MKRKNTARNALFTSIISLLLCVSMLVGTTFAWFTDSVTSANNVIKSGNLDIVLEYWNGTKWVTKGGNGVSKEEVLKSLEPQFKEIKDQFKDITSRINFLSTYHDEYILKLIKELADRVAKLEKFIVTE